MKLWGEDEADGDRVGACMVGDGVDEVGREKTGQRK
jgi:hypothetical protein